MAIAQLLHTNLLKVAVLFIEELEIETTFIINVVHSARCIQDIFQAVSLCHICAVGEAALDGEASSHWVACCKHQASSIHHLIQEDRQLRHSTSIQVQIPTNITASASHHGTFSQSHVQISISSTKVIQHPNRRVGAGPLWC